MAYNSSRGAVLPKTIKAHLLLSELQAEARLERAMAAPVDDDVPRAPSPLDSAQSRRIGEVLA